jgi:hypothetical protein
VPAEVEARRAQPAAGEAQLRHAIVVQEAVDSSPARKLSVPRPRVDRGRDVGIGTPLSEHS